MMEGVCGSARCWNVEGSFTCECENAQDEYIPQVQRCEKRASAGEHTRPLVFEYGQNRLFLETNFLNELCQMFFRIVF